MKLITLPTELIKNLVESITYSTLDFKLENSEFIRIEDIKYIENIKGGCSLFHHAICLVTKKTQENQLFACIYLIDIIACKVVGFYWTKEQSIISRYSCDINGQLYINLYHVYTKLSNTIMPPDERIWVNYLNGIYLLLKEEV